MKYKFSLIALFVAVLDQISKILIRRFMSEGQSISIIENVFHLTYSTNTGIAFGAFKGSAIFSTFIGLIVVMFILYYRKDEISFALILGGAIGNLIDRILFLKVTDFLDFRIWPIFNFADIALTIGIVLLIYEEIISSRKKLTS